MSSMETWKTKERAGLGKPDIYVEKLISVPLNPSPGKEGDGYFDLYYFIHKPPGVRAIKTVLFCAGGPGEIVKPGDGNFLKFLVDQKTAYQVVHFHLRGSGLSQIPASNRFDKFLRTSHAVEDIERIRMAVLEKEPWDGIVGYSYGTVVAQQYASRYKEKGVRKLILIGPLSMHKFKRTTPATATQVLDEYTKAVQEIRQAILEGIIDNNEEFKELRSIKPLFNKLLSDVFEKIESSFSNEHYVADNYEQLRDTGKLNEAGLNSEQYTPLFFEKLRELRNIGWQPIEVEGLRQRQIKAAKVIVKGLQPNLEVTKALGDVEPDQTLGDDPPDGSYRALHVIRTYDGLHRKFLKEWFADDRRDIRAALERSGGKIGGNEITKKVGIADDTPKIWDPADYKHSVPTLVLKGGADPVTADGQAEYYCEQALLGPRTLIEFEGIGHGFDLPLVSITRPYLIGSVRIDPGPFQGLQQKASVETRIPRVARIIEVQGHPNAEKVAEVESRSELDFRDVIILSNDIVLVQVVNKTGAAMNTEGIRLKIKHLIFEGEVVLHESEVPSGLRAETWVKGSLEIRGRNIRLVPPANIEPQLEFVKNSEQIRLPDKVTIEINNTANEAIESEPKNWIYIPIEGVAFEGPCQGENLSSRNCAIYAFLEMEYEDFRQGKSEFLTQIAQFIKTPKHWSV
jgi:pimeloyl-ACP methyl ester carboxylesterase